jgi:hypothetical protein
MAQPFKRTFIYKATVLEIHNVWCMRNNFSHTQSIPPAPGGAPGQAWSSLKDQDTWQPEEGHQRWEFPIPPKTQYRNRYSSCMALIRPVWGSMHLQEPPD